MPSFIKADFPAISARGLPYYVFFGLFAGTLILWAILTRHEEATLRSAMEDQVTMAHEHVTKHLGVVSAAVTRMSNRWRSERGTPQTQWLDDASDYIRDFPGVGALVWVDHAQSVRWIQTGSTHSAESVHAALRGSDWQKSFARVRESDVPDINVMSLLGAGGPVVWVLAPLWVERDFDGVLALGIEIGPFLRFALDDFKDLNPLVVTGTSEIAPFGMNAGGVPPQRTEWSRSRQVPIGSQQWTFFLTPPQILVARYLTPLPRVFLIAGFLVALLGGMSWYLTQVAQRRARGLAEQQSFLVTVIDHLPLIFYCKDAQNGFRFTLWNRQCEEFLGIPRNKGIGHDHHEFFSKEQSARFRARDEQVMASGKLLDIPEDPIEFSVKGRRIMHSIMVPVPDANGKLRYVIGIAQDVTEQKEADTRLAKLVKEQQLVLSQLNAAIDAIPAGFALFGQDGQVRLTNRRFHEIFQEAVRGLAPGYTIKELSRALSNEKLGSPQTWSDNKEAAWQCLNRAAPSSGLALGLGTCDCRHGTLHFHCRRFQTVSGDIAWIREDVTPPMQQQEFLHRREMDLVNAAKLSSLGEMAAGIVHEINNPLTIIDSYVSQLDLLADRGQIDVPEVKKMAGKISSTVHRIARIVRGVQFFAWGNEMGGETPVACSLGQILSDTLGFCQNRFRVADISLRVPEGSENISLECRPVQIAQVLVNLLNNAFDAVSGNPDGEVAIQIEDKGKSVEIRVEDNGPGVPDAIANKIMQPFFTTKEIGESTGLGLSVATGIVHAHGGRLWLDRQTSCTSFVVELPKRQDGSPDGVVPEAQRKDRADRGGQA